MTRVLVIDDDPDVLELVAFKLGKDGYDVSIERDGDAGLATIVETLPDIIVLDWLMPGLSGIDLCRRIRDEAGTAGIPVILLTAKAQSDDVLRGFAAGADDYMIKPFSPSELTSRVGAVLARVA